MSNLTSSDKTTTVKQRDHDSSGQECSSHNGDENLPFSSSSWMDPSYWRSLCPDLTISNTNNDEEDVCDLKRNNRKKEETEGHDGSDENGNSQEEHSLDMLIDGYSLFDDEFIKSKEYATIVQKLASSISTLVSKGWPASYIIMFDEVWILARYAIQLIQTTTSLDNVCNFDILAWHIDPTKNESGFSPHRDRQPDNIASSFFDPCPQESSLVKNNNDQGTAVAAVGHAKYITMWLALSDATPENSCLYIIPAPFDPGYFNGDDANDDEKKGESSSSKLKDANDDSKQQENDDPLRRALSTKESYQNIRALPRKTGEAVMFTHRIMHWGSKGRSRKSQTKNKPRIAISFVARHDSFEKPYVSSDYLTSSTLPPFQIRLVLICAQLLIYYQRFDLQNNKRLVKTYYDIVKANESELESSYRRKVYVEFIKAMKEASELQGEKMNAQQSSSDSAIGDTGEGKEEQQNVVGKTDKDVEDDDDDDEDAMLQEMLDAETEGYGDQIEDDFDEMEGNSGNMNSSDDENIHLSDDDDDEDECEDIMKASELSYKKRKLSSSFN